MADDIKGKIEGQLPDGTGVKFNVELDGMATYGQMQKLLSAFKSRIDKEKSNSGEKLKSDKEAIKSKQEEVKASSSAASGLNKFSDRVEQTSDAFRALKGGLNSVPYSLQGSLNKFDLGMLAAGSSLTGWVMGLGEQVQAGLQMGITGGVLDLSLAAATAGLDLGTFTTALKSSGGAFAQLGNGATDGAKQFSGLVNSVRVATENVGNFGLSNEGMAEFTAQQLKLSVAQGFKGKRAQEMVAENAAALGETFSDVAAQTGKSVLQLAAAAAKLASDPLVTSFVRSAGAAGAAVSKETQKFAANLNGVFGEAGDALGIDALKSAMSGLPFSMTQAGKNMIMSSQALYNEIDNQSKQAASGIEKSAEQQEADRKRLRDIAVEEVQSRGSQLRMMARLEGPAGESARQLLTLASEAQNYNTEASKKSRTDKKVAAEFNSQLNQFKANLQKLAVPILEFVNGIDWSSFVMILNGAVTAISALLQPLSWLASGLTALGPFGEVIGTLAGGGLALFVIWSKLNVISKLLGVNWGKIASAFPAIAGGLARAVGTISGALGQYTKKFGENLTKLAPNLSKKLGGVFDRLKGGLAERAASKVGEKASGKAGSILENAGGKAGGNMGKTIGDFGKGLGKGIGGIFKGLAAGISAFASPQVVLGAVGFGVAIAAIGAGIAGATWLVGKALPTLKEGLTDLSTIDGTALAELGLGLLSASAGIIAFSSAILVSLGASAIGGIAQLFGAKSPLDKIKELNGIKWTGLTELGVALSAIGAALATVAANDKLSSLGTNIKAPAGKTAATSTSATATIQGLDMGAARNTAEYQDIYKSTQGRDKQSRAKAADMQYRSGLAKGTISRPVQEETVPVGPSLVDTQKNAQSTSPNSSVDLAAEQKRTNRLLEQLIENSNVQIGVGTATAQSAAENSRYARQTALNQG